MDEWIIDFFRIVDSMDARAFAEAFDDDGSLRFGNLPPAVGRKQIEEQTRAFHSTVGGMTHRITGVWTGRWAQGDVKSVEAEVTYTRADGTLTPPLPATSTLRMKGSRIKDYRIFIDASPLFGAGALPNQARS